MRIVAAGVVRSGAGQPPHRAGPDGALTAKGECEEAWYGSKAARTCRPLETVEAIGKRRCKIQVECWNDHVWPTPPPTMNEFTKKKSAIRQLDNCSGEVKKTC